MVIGRGSLRISQQGQKAQSPNFINPVLCNGNWRHFLEETAYFSGTTSKPKIKDVFKGPFRPLHSHFTTWLQNPVSPPKWVLCNFTLLEKFLPFSLFPAFQSVYNVYYGNNETLLKVSYCNDFDDNLGKYLISLPNSKRNITLKNLLI